MSFKTNGVLNVFFAILQLFVMIFALLPMMVLFNVPLPSVVDQYTNVAIMFFNEPFYVLCNILNIQTGDVFDYIVFILPFAFFLFLFVFSLALGFRRVNGNKAFGIGLVVEILTSLALIYSLFVVVLYLIKNKFELILLAPILYISVLSLISFVTNVIFHMNN